jgi:dihydrofolate synthase / folylpolyglutamate synthase
MSYKQALDYLYSLQNIRDEWDLEDTRRLLDKIGNPHKKLKVIHVTGSNGKGSVTAMVSSILKQANYKVGSFYSPHVNKFTERIQINNQEIDKVDVEKLLMKVRPFVDGQSFFEIVTAMGFLYFAEQECDFVVLEVGMGGLLDATNVCDSLISVITNVNIEHPEHLGKTIEKIAKQKAGIIKENSICVTGADGIALEIIREECEKKNTKLYVSRPTNIQPGLGGEFQKINGGIAIKTIKALKNYDLNLPKKAIIDGLENATLPGRFHFIEENVLVDAAHNPSGMFCLMDEVRKLNYNNLILVIGILGDKDMKGIVEELLPFSNAIITKPDSHRAADPKTVARLFKHDSKVIENPKDALEYAKSIAKEDDLIVATGSFYTIAPILSEK